jgi:glycine dehydrogenase
MAGLKVVPIMTFPDGNLDLEDLRLKAEKHKDRLAAFMVRTRLLAVILSDHGLTDHISIDIWCLRKRRTRCIPCFIPFDQT